MCTSNRDKNKSAAISGHDNRIAYRDYYELYLEAHPGCLECIQKVMVRHRKEKWIERIFLTVMAAVAGLLLHMVFLEFESITSAMDLMVK